MNCVHCGNPLLPSEIFCGQCLQVSPPPQPAAPAVQVATSPPDPKPSAVQSVTPLPRPAPVVETVIQPPRQPSSAVQTVMANPTRPPARVRFGSLGLMLVVSTASVVVGGMFVVWLLRLYPGLVSGTNVANPGQPANVTAGGVPAAPRSAEPAPAAAVADAPLETVVQPASPEPAVTPPTNTDVVQASTPDQPKPPEAASVAAPSPPYASQGVVVYVPDPETSAAADDRPAYDPGLKSDSLDNEGDMEAEDHPYFEESDVDSEGDVHFEPGDPSYDDEAAPGDEVEPYDPGS